MRQYQTNKLARFGHAPFLTTRLTKFLHFRVVENGNLCYFVTSIRGEQVELCGPPRYFEVRTDITKGE